MKKNNGVLTFVDKDDIELLKNNPNLFWENITSIGDNAFSYRSNLTSIEIPDSVTSIGNGAFSNCSCLTSIVIPDSVTSIGNGAFLDCSNLTSIVIPDSVTSIGTLAFSNCGGLTSIVIPDSVITINPSTFNNCSNLTNIVIPDSVTSIGNGAFLDCSNLTSIVIPDSVTNIGDGAFYDCRSLTSIEIPDSVTSIGASAFSSCSNLTSIEIPDSVTSVGNYIFEGCSNLTSIVIPDSVTNIGDGAFYDCRSLTSIEIPDSVTNIGNYAFDGCSNLTSIDIPDSVTSIGDGAFMHCSNLTSIEIPDSVTSIGASAFSSCSNLTSVLISNSVKKIRSETFFDCSNLTNIEIPDSVETIENTVFLGCSNLTSIVIPNSVTSIGRGAFTSCSNLKSIEIPDSVTSIGYSALTDVPEVTVFGKRIAGNMLSEQMFNYLKENRDFNLAQFNKIYGLAKEKGLDSYNRSEFETLCVNLGLLENKSTKMKIGTQKNGQPNMVPVSDVAYTFLQGLINSGDLELDALHMNLQEMKIEGYNEEFLKFVTNKTNWSDIKQNMTTLPRVYDWFKERTNLDLSQTSEGYLLPTSEENRFKICVYETTQNGVDRIKWKTPTMEYLLKEFVEKKFTGIDSSRNKEIAEEIGKFNIYSQKHYDKAKEIDRERIDRGVKDVLKNPIKQDRIASLDEYRAKTEAIKNQILSDSASILSDQITDTSNIFTYEVLSKSDPANFAMGCMTSCCATLYGAGAGAMRAMIIHPDIQPLVIRDFDNNIIAFGIIYVNREQGYAVVNDFEVNSKYQNRQEQRKAIYEKAMEGVKKFVEEYNEENPTKEIERVTCGCSPNWTAINDYIQSHPQSEILKAPNFDDFKYAGSGSWNGDWHRSQYEIWRKEDENERY